MSELDKWAGHPALPEWAQRERHMRGVITGRDGRPFCTIMPPCEAGHNCCEWIGDECMLCWRDRWWAEIGVS